MALMFYVGRAQLKIKSSEKRNDKVYRFFTFLKVGIIKSNKLSDLYFN